MSRPTLAPHASGWPLHTPALERAFPAPALAIPFGARLLCSRPLTMFLSSNRQTATSIMVAMDDWQGALIVGGWEGYVLQSWRLLCSRLLTSVLSGARRGWEGYVLQRSVNMLPLPSLPLACIHWVQV